MIKFLKKIYIFIKSEKLFFPPKNKKNLVFDGNNNPFEHYIIKNDMEVLFTRGEKINLFILLKCLLKNKLDVNNYLKEYIKYVNPKLILTFIDNSRIFYSKNSNHIYELTFSFIQTKQNILHCFTLL